MSKPVIKRNKREERKKMIVRIVCIALAVLMLVSSLGTVIYYMAASNDNTYTVEELIEAGIMYVDEEGNYQFSQEYLDAQAAADDHDHDEHEGHNHE